MWSALDGNGDTVEDLRPMQGSSSGRMDGLKLKKSFCVGQESVRSLH